MLIAALRHFGQRFQQSRIGGLSCSSVGDEAGDGFLLRVRLMKRDAALLQTANDVLAARGGHLRDLHWGGTVGRLRLHLRRGYHLRRLHRRPRGMNRRRGLLRPRLRNLVNILHALHPLYGS